MSVEIKAAKPSGAPLPEAGDVDLAAGGLRVRHDVSGIQGGQGLRLSVQMRANEGTRYLAVLFQRTDGGRGVFQVASDEPSAAAQLATRRLRPAELSAVRAQLTVLLARDAELPQGSFGKIPESRRRALERMVALLQQALAAPQGEIAEPPVDLGLDIQERVAGGAWPYAVESQRRVVNGRELFAGVSPLGPGLNTPVPPSGAPTTPRRPDVIPPLRPETFEIGSTTEVGRPWPGGAIEVRNLYSRAGHVDLLYVPASAAGDAAQLKVAVTLRPSAYRTEWRDLDHNERQAIAARLQRLAATWAHGALLGELARVMLANER